MNPTAIVFFIFGVSFGFSIGDIQGAAIGLAITSGLTLVAEAVTR